MSNTSNKIIASPVDTRDYLYKNEGQELPVKYLASSTPVRCQWFSSQCVAYACTQALTQAYKLANNQVKLFSPGSLYANREEDDYQGEGWYVRKALKQLHKYGVCLEQDFPFPESYAKERQKFLARKEELLKLCEEYKIKSYFRCETAEDVKACIMKYGSVVISSKFTPKCFWKSKLTKEDYPEKSGGGHAIILVGWDETGWIAQDSYSIFRPWFGKVHLAYNYPIQEFWGIEI